MKARKATDVATTATPQDVLQHATELDRIVRHMFPHGQPKTADEFAEFERKGGDADDSGLMVPPADEIVAALERFAQQCRERLLADDVSLVRHAWKTMTSNAVYPDLYRFLPEQTRISAGRIAWEYLDEDGKKRVEQEGFAPGTDEHAWASLVERVSMRTAARYREAEANNRGLASLIRAERHPRLLRDATNAEQMAYIIHNGRRSVSDFRIVFAKVRPDLGNALGKARDDAIQEVLARFANERPGRRTRTKWSALIDLFRNLGIAGVSETTLETAYKRYKRRATVPAP